MYAAIEEGVLLPREYEELTHMLASLPSKMIQGLSTADVVLTSIDVTFECIAVGTNVGLVYLYDRTNQTNE